MLKLKRKSRKAKLVAAPPPPPPPAAILFPSLEMTEKATPTAPAPVRTEAPASKRNESVLTLSTTTARRTPVLHDASTVDVYVRLEPSGPLFGFHREVLSENEVLSAALASSVTEVTNAKGTAMQVLELKLPAPAVGMRCLEFLYRPAEIYLEPETLKTQFWMFYENGVELEFEELVAYLEDRFPSIWKDVTTSDALTPARIPLARFASLLWTLANVDGESRLRLLLLYASRGSWNLQRMAALKRMTFTEITRATKDTTISLNSLSKMSQDFPRVFNEAVPAVIFSTRKCVHCKSQVEIFRSGWNKASLYSVKLACGCKIEYFGTNGQRIESMTGTGLVSNRPTSGYCSNCGQINYNCCCQSYQLTITLANASTVVVKKDSSGRVYCDTHRSWNTITTQTECAHDLQLDPKALGI
ncbi:hypothetical protein HDU96_010035 [Phlyctochytrium bullatum]|nr:hypothetical protein HDU96_010035 [Phlyctochytrium bullatum]